jgi:VWFA-related protein
MLRSLLSGRGISYHPWIKNRTTHLSALFSRWFCHSVYTDPSVFMKLLAAVALLGMPALLAQTPAPPTPQPEQQPDSQTATLTVHSTLVLVPALVRTKSGQLVYTLKADDFVLTDDGVEQKLSLEEDSGSQPLALVVLVETGSDGAQHLQDYRDLAPMLDNMLGGIEHRVAVVGFDSEPQLLQNFTRNIDGAAGVLADLDPGDQKGAIFDALSYAVDMLRKQPTTYRRAILLLSETIDHGSHTKLEDALKAISDTNTAIYSVGFASTKAEIKHEASKFSSAEPGPPHGCFSKDPNQDPATYEGRATQNFDCFAELAPPLRLIKMAVIAATNAMRSNASENVAKFTGGEHFKYKDAKTLQRDLFTISNHIPNRYVLSFHPQSPHPGLHSVTLQLRNYSDLVVQARSSYWVDGGTTVTTPADKP